LLLFIPPCFLLQSWFSWWPQFIACCYIICQKQFPLDTT
jgi:hypothetical protein